MLLVRLTQAGLGSRRLQRAVNEGYSCKRNRWDSVPDECVQSIGVGGRAWVEQTRLLPE
jgi:hypothetical protein